MAWGDLVGKRENESPLVRGRVARFATRPAAGVLALATDLSLATEGEDAFRGKGCPTEERSDLLSIRTDEGWFYLSAILDMYSRKVVGWAMDQTMETSLIANSLDMALANRRPVQGLIHHSA